MELKLVALAAAAIGFANAQSQAIAAAKMEFDVASIKLNKSNARPTSNFPLGPGDVYIPNGGSFSAAGFPLIAYIAFAFKLTGNETQSLLSRLPGWIAADRFDIQARAASNPDKNQMRLMMRSLLADRFKLAIHTETRQASVFALLLSKPGKTGPQLQRHSDDAPCLTAPSSSPPTTPSGFPTLCGGFMAMPPSAPGRVHYGGRNMTIDSIAKNFDWPDILDQPVLNQTGLNGTFDFSIEWTPEAAPSTSPSVVSTSDSSGPTLVQALKEQLGLKLESTKRPVEFSVIDHVERPDVQAWRYCTPGLWPDGTSAKLKTLPVRFDVPLEALAPGEYNCQITVLNANAHKAAFWQAPVMLVP